MQRDVECRWHIKSAKVVETAIQLYVVMQLHWQYFFHLFSLDFRKKRIEIIVIEPNYYILH